MAEEVTTPAQTSSASIWIDDARVQFLKLWSVRFSLMISLFGVVQTGMAIYTDESPWAAVITVVLGVVTAISRVVRQPKLKAKDGWLLSENGSLGDTQSGSQP